MNQNNKKHRHQYHFMSKFILTALLFSSLLVKSQTMQEIQDRIAIKNIVDTFSILADTKEIDKQVLLFTENASVESIVNGQNGTTITGRKQIGDAFKAFLDRFETVYHINGQQTVTLNGDKAIGISYCQVTLIGTQSGKKMKATFGIKYKDEFIRESSKWLIAKRTSNFLWTETVPFGQ